jgi:hypothetical protein
MNIVHLCRRRQENLQKQDITTATKEKKKYERIQVTHTQKKKKRNTKPHRS